MISKRRVISPPLGAVFSIILFVLAAQPALAAFYRLNENKTVTDVETKLLWQRGETEHDWAGAVAYCEGLQLGGYDDWRLPEVEELLSLIESGMRSPAINMTYFPETSFAGHWSATKGSRAKESSTEREGLAWYVNLYRGTERLGVLTYKRATRCVRDGS